MKIDPKWHKDQVDLYTAEYPRYEAYASVLKEILERACRIYAPLAIVQVRPKSVASFAEKAARKAFKYPNPVHQITDLCGARVITRTQEEADEICEFIRANLAVDEANSLNTRARLTAKEFDYLSLHFVVQMKGDPLLGVAPRIETIGARKAEIQVRTLLQHAWADITHDRLYKSAFHVPEKFRRDGALLAAAMEHGDGSFARFEKGFRAYEGSYAAYADEDKRQQEMAIAKVVLRNEPRAENKPAIALRIGRIANAAGDDETTIATLDPFADVETLEEDALRLELAKAYLRRSKRQPDAPDYRRGRALLSRIIDPGSAGAAKMLPERRQMRILRAEALALLAWSCQDIQGQECQARDLYRRALQLDPLNPYHFTSLLEYEAFCTQSHEFMVAVKPSLLAAVTACRSHTQVGIEVPRAFFTIGKLHLLMDEPYESLSAYAKAVAVCNREKACVAPDVYDEELRSLRRLNAFRSPPPEHEWARELLLLGKSAKGASRGLCEELQGKGLRKAEAKEPILIVVGGASPAIEEEMRKYHDYLVEALAGFEGTVISGGTDAGIPGLVGAVTEEMRRAGTKKFTALAYLSRHLPADAPKDKRYDETVITDGKTLSPHEPLQSWIDLLAAGVRPQEVRVLGINGGRIAAFEYRLALALGAKVGVMQHSGRAAPELFDDPDWNQMPNLFRLPMDPATALAFANPLPAPWPRDVLDTLGQIVHAKYCEVHKGKLVDPSVFPWGELRPDLQDSNRQQAAYAARTLRKVGYGVRPAKGTIRFPDFTPEEVEVMAEVEHGRWNAERLAAGWKWGPVRDIANKINPALVAWRDLPDDIRKYDRDAVKGLPEVLAKAGLEVYRLESGEAGR